VLSPRPRGARSMPAHAGTAISAPRVMGSPSRLPQDSCGPSSSCGPRVPQDRCIFTVGDAVEYKCKQTDGWVNAIIASTNADGSYTLDVQVDASPTKLRRPGEEIFKTRIPEDAFKTRVPAELLQDESMSVSQEQQWQQPR